MKMKSATNVIPWQCKLRTDVQFPCDPLYHLVKGNVDPKVKSVADIFVVALH